jgi:hypothetical protein
MLNLLQRRKLTPNGPAAGETTENENKKNANIQNEGT